MAAYTLTASATSPSVPNGRRKRKRSSTRKRSPPRKSRTRQCPSARNRMKRSPTPRNRRRRSRKKRSRMKNPSRPLYWHQPGVHCERDFLVSQTSLPPLPRERFLLRSFYICPISTIGYLRDHARKNLHARGQYHR